MTREMGGMFPLAGLPAPEAWLFPDVDASCWGEQEQSDLVAWYWAWATVPPGTDFTQDLTDVLTGAVIRLQLLRAGRDDIAIPEDEYERLLRSLIDADEALALQVQQAFVDAIRSFRQRRQRRFAA